MLTVPGNIIPGENSRFGGLLPPTVSGVSIPTTIVVGTPISVSYTLGGGPATVVTRAWYRGTTLIASSTTSDSYTPVQADAGNTSNIFCRVIPVNAAGSASADSNTVAQVMDANANTILVNSGVSDATTRAAINRLTLNLKGNGDLNSSIDVWSFTNRCHPYIGSSGSTFAYNLKTGTQTFTFNGGWTYNSNGPTPNGTNAYISTGVNATTISAALSSGICRISAFNTNSASSGADGYVLGSNTYFYLYPKFTDNNLYTRNYNATEQGTTQVNVDTRNIYQQKIFSGAGSIRRAKATVFTQNPNQTPSSSGNEFLSAFNLQGSPTNYDNRQRNFDMLILGMNVTNTLSDLLVDIINAYQTDMGRNNYQP